MRGERSGTKSPTDARVQSHDLDVVVGLTLVAYVVSVLTDFHPQIAILSQRVESWQGDELLSASFALLLLLVWYAWRHAKAAQRQDVVAAELREVDRQKTEFVALAPHELRTPLTSVQGFASLLAESDALGA